MLRHHFMARVSRLRRVIDEAELKVAALFANEATDRTTKRVRTMMVRTLTENRQSLADLIKRHGAEFGLKNDPEIGERTDGDETR